MFDIKKVEREIGGRTISLENGRMARAPSLNSMRFAAGRNAPWLYSCQISAHSGPWKKVAWSQARQCASHSSRVYC